MSTSSLQNLHYRCILINISSIDRCITQPFHSCIIPTIVAILFLFCIWHNTLLLRTYRDHRCRVVVSGKGFCRLYCCIDFIYSLHSPECHVAILFLCCAVASIYIAFPLLHKVFDDVHLLQFVEPAAYTVTTWCYIVLLSLLVAWALPYCCIYYIFPLKLHRYHNACRWSSSRSCIVCMMIHNVAHCIPVLQWYPVKVKVAPCTIWSCHRCSLPTFSCIIDRYGDPVACGVDRCIYCICVRRSRLYAACICCIVIFEIVGYIAFHRDYVASCLLIVACYLLSHILLH